MFVTRPEFKQFVPPEFSSPGLQHWRAVTLPLENPWYLFLYEAQHAGTVLPETALIAWESALIDLLGAVPAENRLGICRMEKRVIPDPGWDQRWVSAVWAASTREAEQTGGLIFQFQGEAGLRNTFMEPVRDGRGRKLLFEAPRRHQG